MNYRYCLELSYKGTHYCGWQIQPNARTVQEVLHKALQTLLKTPVNTVGCGRTDSGVHASYFIAHFDLSFPLPGDEHAKLVYQLNALLPFDIAIHRIFEVPSTFHARFDALEREYQYFIHFQKNPFLTETSWLRKENISIDSMNAACELLIGTKDFKCFSKSNTQVKTTICHVRYAHWNMQNNQLVFTIRANRFLRNMVRAIVGTMIDIGTNKLTLQEFEEVLLNGNRSDAGVSVPACGLFLTKVTYPHLPS